MVNRQVWVQGEGVVELKQAMSLAWANVGGSAKGRATHYAEHSELGLVLFWGCPKSAPGPEVHKLPGRGLGLDAAVDLVWRWITEVRDEDRAEWTDKASRLSGGGFRLTTRGAGIDLFEKQKNDPGAPYEITGYEICAVQAIWAWHGVGQNCAG